MEYFPFVMQTFMLVAMLIQLTTPKGTMDQKKNKIHQEDAFCTNFTASVTVTGRERFVVTVTLGQSFWEAVRYFGVSQISFEPTLEGNGGFTMLDSIRCRQNGTICQNVYEFTDINVNPDIHYDLTIDIGCLPPKFTSYPCDGDCEALSRGVSFRGIDTKTTQKPKTPQNGVKEQIEPWIFVILGAVFLSVIFTVAIFLRRRYMWASLDHNSSHFLSQVPESDSDSRSLIEQLDILLIASSTGMSEEIRTFMKLLREKESIKVTFHEEEIREVVRNENDWVDLQFERADFIIVAISEAILEHSEFPGLNEKLLRRLESEAAIGRMNYAGVCFKKSGDIRMLNTLNKMKTIHRLLDFLTIFYFSGILQTPLDNRLDYSLTSLVKLMRDVKRNSEDLHKDTHEERNGLLAV